MSINVNFKSRFRILSKGRVVLAISPVLASVLLPGLLSAAPVGGTVLQGQANINQSGLLTNIHQSSTKATINWQGFSINKNETVNFNQPNAASVTLNRVVGNEKSVIAGMLNANGQVFLLNPNGVVISKTGQINTSGFLASTQLMNDEDFLNSSYNLVSNGSSQNVINMGTITIKNEGYAALIGNSVSNEGTISAIKGTVHLNAADEVSINLNGNSLVNITVKKSVLNALVENKGAVFADGGTIYLTANAADSLLASAINNTGTLQARTLEGLKGDIQVISHGGVADISGTLDASASKGGNGGSIETSGNRVHIAEGTRITTHSSDGENGTWLIDPTDFTIAASGGDMSGATLSSNLATSNVTIQSTDGSNGTAGDIYVNDGASWTSGNTLTLEAQNNIHVNATLDASGGNGGKVNLYYGQGSSSGTTSGYDFGLGSEGFSGKINLKSGQNFNTKLGSSGSLVAWNVITALGNAGDATTDTTNSLQGLAYSSKLSGNYVLGADIDASATAAWNENAGFAPIGSSSLFAGSFDGIGHTIDGLSINRAGSNIGLFGFTAYGSSVKNIGLTQVNITGDASSVVGSLVGWNAGTVSGAYATGNVKGLNNTGGLVGVNGFLNIGAIDHSHTSVNVNADGIRGSLTINSGTVMSITTTPAGAGGTGVGGLAGSNNGTISDSYVTGDVSANGGEVYSNGSVLTGFWAKDGGAGGSQIGGLVGSSSGTVSNSYATGDIHANGKMEAAGGSLIGGLIGLNSGTVTGSHASANTYVNGDTSAAGGTSVGGLVGGNLLGSISNSYSEGNVNANGSYNSFWSDGSTGGTNIGGLIGWNNGGAITNVRSSANVNANGGNGEYSGGYNDGGNGANGGNSVGGLIGSNSGYITNAYASGTVSANGGNGGFSSDGSGGAGGTGGTKIGGLIGWNYGGGIADAYSVASVSARGGNGGGCDSGGCYHTGGTGGSNIGGLVGTNGATISNTYAAGTVNGQGGAGGIDRLGRQAGSGSAGSNIGGVAGSNAAAVSNSYWEIDTTGQTNAIGADMGTLANTSGLRSSTGTITAFSQNSYHFVNSSGNSVFGTTWFMVDDFTRPILASEYSTTITNAHQLQLMGLHPDADYVLANDIDLSLSANTRDIWNTARGFGPIGLATPFSGTFDGKGYAIDHLTINSAGANVGLFGISSGAIDNVVLSNVNITGSGTNASIGGVVGTINSGGSVRNTSVVSGSIAGAGSDQSIGGIAGTNNGAITYTSADEALSSSGSRGSIGGIAGTNTRTIENTYSESTITGNETSVNGGIAGTNSGTIADSLFNGTISGGGVHSVTTPSSNQEIACLVVGVDGCHYKDPDYATSHDYTKVKTITTPGSSISLNYSGGIAGTSSGTITDSFWNQDKNINTGTSTIHPISDTGNNLNLIAGKKSSEQLMAHSNYSGWNLLGGTGMFPVIRFGGDHSYWHMFQALNYELDAITKIYDGYVADLSGWTSASIFGSSDYAGWKAGDDYEFIYEGNHYTSLEQLSFKDAGNYSNISVALKPSKTADYSIAATGNTNGSVTIDPKTVTVSGTVVGDKTYDGTTAASVNNYGTLSGVVSGDSVSLNHANTAANFQSPNAGSNVPVLMPLYTIGGADAHNYRLSVQPNVTANINKALLTITADDVSKEYDGEAYKGNYSVTYNGFVNHENSTDLGGSLSYATNPDEVVNPELYQIIPSGLLSSNYTIVYNPGQFTVFEPAEANKIIIISLISALRILNQITIPLAIMKNRKINTSSNIITTIDDTFYDTIHKHDRR